MLGLRNLSVPSWAGPCRTLLGVTALPYCLFQREGDVSEYVNFLGWVSVANGLKDQGFVFVYSVPAPPCLHLFPSCGLYEFLLQTVWKSRAGCFHLGKTWVYAC